MNDIGKPECEMQTRAIALFRDISLAPEFVEFLTIPAYRLIV